MVPEIVPEKREAEPILVHLANKTFHLLIYNEKLYIPTHEGLALIGVELNWLCFEKNSRRGKLLKRQNFSFKEILLCYETGIRGKYVFVEAYSYEDFLIVWSYFASKGNSRALRVLMWLAQFGLNQYLKPWGDTDGMVSGVCD
jgi:hypothetical protein